MHESRTSIPLWCLAATAFSCAEDARVEQTQTPLLLTAEQAESPVADIGARQRDLLRALTDANADPTPYMTAGFHLIDRDDPNTRRSPGGQYIVGADRLQTLSRRLPPDYSIVQHMDVMLQRSNHAVVVVRHGSVSPTVTHWEKIGNEWQAAWLTINVPEEILAELPQRIRESMLADSARRVNRR